MSMSELCLCLMKHNTWKYFACICYRSVIVCNHVIYRILWNKGYDSRVFQMSMSCQNGSTLLIDLHSVLVDTPWYCSSYLVAKFLSFNTIVLLLRQQPITSQQQHNPQHPPLIVNKYIRVLVWGTMNVKLPFWNRQ